MGNQQATATEIGWLAGIIDGEGHIGLSKQNSAKFNTIRFDLQIVNTDFAITDRVVAIYNKLGVNPHVRNRVHDKASLATNRIVSLCKMAHIRIVLTAVLDNLTGVKKERAIIMQALIESRLGKKRTPYTQHEYSLIAQFKDRFIGKCGASTTARDAADNARRRYSLASHESARGRSEEVSPPV